MLNVGWLLPKFYQRSGLILYNSSSEINAYHTFNERFIVYMINNEAAEKLIIFMMDKAITYRNRKLCVLGTLKKP